MNAVVPEDLAERIERLADALSHGAGPTFPAWRGALFAAPRHLFVPTVAWAQPDRRDAEGYAIDRNSEPALWWDTVYSDSVIVTQTADGAGQPASGAGPATSSCSAPGIVFKFLEQLKPLDHHRVLEIGTGTGWTAALLSWRVGEHNVVTIEIDAEVCAQAAENLKQAGLQPRLVAADGTDGLLDGGPYDRVHVACGVTRLPYAWIEQSRPGGVIVFPWSTGWSWGHLTRLTVTGDGRAVGGFAGPAGFMMLRSQRRPPGDPESFTFGAEGAERSSTRLDPRSVTWDSPGADVAIAALVPDTRAQMTQTEAGGWRVWVLENNPEGSWAVADFRPGQAEFTVEQGGDRRLWDEVEAAYLRWISWGRPDRERFGLTVDGVHQRIWLDSPDRPVTP